MSEVGIRALKQNASAVVAQVVSGDAVVITDRGRPVAQMVALVPGEMEAMVASARVRSAKRRLSELPPAVRRKADAARLSDVLDEMRRGERY